MSRAVPVGGIPAALHLPKGAQVMLARLCVDRMYGQGLAVPQDDPAVGGGMMC